MARKRKPKTAEQLPLTPAVVEDASLGEEAYRRFLNYALSVITARALPDVRDGLKPVQRRILYTMYNELRLLPASRYRKSAAIVGDVMGKFHPHGDTAIYDALVRMAQPFSMRACLVDGRGNFGSPDGDGAAAMRYTEAKLTPLAATLMTELAAKTVDFRPNYDGTRFEPVVLPAPFANLLVNGAYGIAVGMATSIPPHNFQEVTRACIALVDDPKATLRDVLKHIKGPDFPTGGELMATSQELRSVYEEGHGSLKLRGTWKPEGQGGTARVVIDSIPFAVERRTVVEKIADVVLSKKLPGLVDVRDESTEVCRIVCELSRGADPELVMAYLHKHTPLTQGVHFNLTCLMPSDDGEVSSPQRVSLLTMLHAFLKFRMDVVVRRLRHALAEVEKRIHVLEGFEIVFDALDETIRIIRRSEGRQDAAEKLIQRFDLDEAQVDAILELRLYRLAKLEILVIQKELKEKQKLQKNYRKLLKRPDERWGLIREELREASEAHGTPRSTRIVGKVQEVAFAAEDFIVDEDAVVVLTEQGWVKRQQSVRSIQSVRVREGDRVLHLLAGSTRTAVAFFSSAGVCYVQRLVDVPATSGYGVHVKTLFQMGDGERVVSALGFDPRVLYVPTDDDGDLHPFAVGVTRGGLASRFSLRTHGEPSKKNGRRFMKVGDGDEVIHVGWCEEGDIMACASLAGRALLCGTDDVSVLTGPGKGVRLIKLDPKDQLLGARVLDDDRDALAVVSDGGKRYEISPRKHDITSRGGKGFRLLKRGGLSSVQWPEPVVPDLSEDE